MFTRKAADPEARALPALSRQTLCLRKFEVFTPTKVAQRLQNFFAKPEVLVVEAADQSSDGESLPRITTRAGMLEKVIHLNRGVVVAAQSGLEFFEALEHGLHGVRGKQIAEAFQNVARPFALDANSMKHRIGRVSIHGFLNPADFPKMSMKTFPRDLADRRNGVRAPWIGP